MKYPEWPANPRIEELKEIIKNIKEVKTIPIPKYWPNFGEDVNGHEIDDDDFLELDEVLVRIEGKSISVTNSGEATVTIGAGSKSSDKWTEPEFIRLFISDAKKHKDLSDKDDLEEIREEIGTSHILLEKTSSNEDFVEAVLDANCDIFKYTATELNSLKIHVIATAFHSGGDRYLTATIYVMEDKWTEYKYIAEYILNSIEIRILE